MDRRMGARVREGVGSTLALASRGYGNPKQESREKGLAGGSNQESRGKGP